MSAEKEKEKETEATSSTTPEKTEPLFLQPSVKVNGKFANPWDGYEARGFKHVIKWYANHTNENGIPEQPKLESTLPLHPTDHSLLANPPADKVQVTWVGHSTVLVQMDGLNLLTDPVFAERCSPLSFAGTKRLRPPPLAISELPRIDLVVISHNHYDHLSHPDVLQLGNTPLWCVPLGLKKWMNDCGITNVHELDWWGEHRLRVNDKDFLVTCVPAQHWSKRGLFDDNTTLWSGWTVAGPNLRFYYSGDTGYCPVFEQIGKKCGPFDLAAIPVSAPSFPILGL